MIAICQKLYHYASNVLDSKFEWRPENETHKKICQSISLSPFGLQEQKYHRLGGLTNISFSQYWRLRSLRSRHQQIQRLREDDLHLSPKYNSFFVTLPISLQNKPQDADDDQG